MIKRLFEYDLFCSICLSQYVRPTTLMCGHSFCMLCLYKYLLQYPKKCPMCRNNIRCNWHELRVNVVLDALSRKLNPKKYSKILAHNEAEEDANGIIEQLEKKFDHGGQNYRPSMEDRTRLFFYHLRWYYTRMRIVVTIIAPIIILIWYFRYRKKLDKSKYWEDMRKH